MSKKRNKLSTDFSEIPQLSISPSEAKKHYEKFGFHVEFDVWEAQEIKNINDQALKFSAPKLSDYRPLMHPHRDSDIFLNALKNPKIVKIAEHFLSGEISGLQTEYFFGAPGTKGFANHQDNFYLEAEQHAFGSVWSAMSIVTPERGGLYIYPGTHLEPVLEVKKLGKGSGPNQDPNAANEESVVPAKYEKVDVRLQPGSIIFLHGHLVHGSYQNQSDHFRKALLKTYIIRGKKFRAGRTAKRVEIPLR